MTKIGTGTKGTKYVKTKWPITSGTTAGTTKQEGRQIALVAQKGSNVPRKDKVGLNV